MTHLLDTHVVYWHLFEPTRLSTASRQAIAEGEVGKARLIVSTVALAELYFLLRRIQVDGLFPDVVTDLQNNSNYLIEPMVLEGCKEQALQAEANGTARTERPRHAVRRSPLDQRLRTTDRRTSARRSFPVFDERCSLPGRSSAARFAVHLLPLRP